MVDKIAQKIGKAVGKSLNRDDDARTDAPEETQGVPLNAKQNSVPSSNPVNDQQYENGAYGGYLFRNAGTVDKPAWSDSIQGRAAIRLISRGVVGSFCFVAGGRYARTQMMDYHPETFAWDSAKPLQALAKVFDVAFGKPIAAMTRAVGHVQGKSAAEIETSVWNAVNFRSKAYYHNLGGKILPDGRAMNGRSLGSEMVNISFDFAMASIGDSSTRNFFQMIDPNIRKSWLVNDEGKPAKEGEQRHFDFSKFMQSTGKAAWRVLSKNQGEDWAVALPYVYQMKWQREALSHSFRNELKGAKLGFDNSWNGAAYKVNAEGQVIGDYNLIGAVDLHARFVGYNVYTLMFREAYDKIGIGLDAWKKNGYHLDVHLPENPLAAVAHEAKEAVRYVAKSVIKANLYMNPSVIPFWMMRVPQTKWRSGMINPELEHSENAIASNLSFNERLNIGQRRWREEAGVNLTTDEFHERMVTPKGIRNHNSAKYRSFPASATQETVYFGNSPASNPFHGISDPHDPALYAHYKTDTTYEKVNKTFSQTLNPIGQFANWVGKKTARATDHLPNGAFKHFISLDDAGKFSDAARQSFIHQFTDASLAYTPYMFAKAEFGMRVDDRPSNGQPGKMDKAIYRFIDNVCGLNLGGIKQSVREIWDLGTDLDRPLKPREGVVVDDAKTKVPDTKVVSDGRERDDVVVPSGKDSHAVTDEGQDKQWAEAVVGRTLDAQFCTAPSHARH